MNTIRPQVSFHARLVLAWAVCTGCSPRIGKLDHLGTGERPPCTLTGPSCPAGWALDRGGPCADPTELCYTAYAYRCGGGMADEFSCRATQCDAPACPPEFADTPERVFMHHARCGEADPTSGEPLSVGPRCVDVDACGVPLACNCREMAPCLEPDRTPCAPGEPACLALTLCGRPAYCRYESTECAPCAPDEFASRVPCVREEVGYGDVCRWPVGCEEMVFCHRVGDHGTGGCLIDWVPTDIPCGPGEEQCEAIFGSAGVHACRPAGRCGSSPCPAGWREDAEMPCGLAEPDCRLVLCEEGPTWCRDPGLSPCDDEPVCPSGRASAQPCLEGEAACRRVTSCGWTLFCR